MEVWSPSDKVLENTLMQKLKQTTTSAEESTNKGTDRNSLVSDLVAGIQLFFY